MSWFRSETKYVCRVCGTEFCSRESRKRHDVPADCFFRIMENAKWDRYQNGSRFERIEEQMAESNRRVEELAKKVEECNKRVEECWAQS